MWSNNKKQEQKQLTAHDKILLFNNLRYLLEGLEEYVEKTGYYPDFKNKRQLKNITIPREQARNLSRDDAEDFFKTNLVLFVSMANEAPDFLKTGELRDEYYKWINLVGIDIKNCRDEKLKHFLIEINNILEGDSDKVVNQTQEYLDSRAKTNQNNPQDLIKVFGAIQGPLNRNREQAELLKDKTHKDIEVANKFGGSIEQGRQAFDGISRSTSNYDEFNLYRSNYANYQQRPNFEIVQDVKNNPQNWGVDEVVAEYNVLGGAKKKELALIHRSVNLGPNGEIIGSLDRQPVYLLSRFSRAEIAEINRAKNISQTSTSQPIRQELVNKIKQNARLERGLFVINRDTGERSENEDWFIHNSLERKIDSRTGYLIHVPNAMFRAKDLSEAEQKSVGYKSEQNLQNSSVSANEKDNDKGIDSGGIFAVITAVSILLIASVVVVKKRFNKKVKK